MLCRPRNLLSKLIYLLLVEENCMKLHEEIHTKYIHVCFILDKLLIYFIWWEMHIIKTVTISNNRGECEI